MADSKRYKIPIPDGYRIYEKEINIAGLHYREKAFSIVIKKGRRHSIYSLNRITGTTGGFIRQGGETNRLFAGRNCSTDSRIWRSIRSIPPHRHTLRPSGGSRPESRTGETSLNILNPTLSRADKRV